MDIFRGILDEVWHMGHHGYIIWLTRRVCALLEPCSLQKPRPEKKIQLDVWAIRIYVWCTVSITIMDKTVVFCTQTYRDFYSFQQQKLSCRINILSFINHRWQKCSGISLKFSPTRLQFFDILPPVCSHGLIRFFSKRHNWWCIVLNYFILWTNSDSV